MTLYLVQQSQQQLGNIWTFDTIWHLEKSRITLKLTQSRGGSEREESDATACAKIEFHIFHQFNSRGQTRVRAPNSTRPSCTDVKASRKR